jgi:hypothetical protein
VIAPANAAQVQQDINNNTYRTDIGFVAIPPR